MPLRLDNTKEIRLQIDRIKYWLSVGAQPSDRVAYLLWRAGLMPPPPIRYTPAAWVPKKEAKAKGARGFHTLVHAVYGPYAGAVLGRGSAAPLTMVELFGGRMGGGMLLRLGARN